MRKLKKRFYGMIMVGPNNNRNYWYRQQVVDRIHDLFSTGDLNGVFKPQVLKNNEITLFEASIILFGGWENALYKAGLETKNLTKLQQLFRNYWLEDTILEQIEILYDGGFDLSARFIRLVYPELYFAAKNKMHFGSWSEATTQAEVDNKYLTSMTNSFWTRKRIFEAIADINQEYGSLQPGFVRENNPSLYSSAHRFFKTWSEAVSAAGHNLNKNFYKAILEPLRTFILKDLIRKVYEILGVKFNVVPYGTDNNLDSEIEEAEKSNIDSRKIISEIVGEQNFYLELVEGKDKSCVTANFQGWKFGWEKEITELLSKYPKVRCFYAIGEPRRWLNDKVEFINLDHFYPELTSLGRDDIILAISHYSRGGMPGKYEEWYETFMKKIKKMVDENKKKK